MNEREWENLFSNFQIFKLYEKYAWYSYNKTEEIFGWEFPSNENARDLKNGTMKWKGWWTVLFIKMRISLRLFQWGKRGRK